MKKFTVIVPVYNEKSGIKDFLHSLYQQTRTPDEIIIVDGGSTDGTYQLLLHEQKEGKIVVLQNTVRHGNIARSRNLAIHHAKHDILLCTDAGCHVDKHWCENYMHIYETTDKKVLGGKSEFIAPSQFQKKCVARLTSIVPNFPSRNVSFYKSVRKEVGGYPEDLTLWAEDTYFNYKIQKAGYTFFYCPNAIVSRYLRENFFQIYKMYRNYTQGDVEVYMIHHVIQSDSIKQAVRFGVVGLILLWIVMTFSGLGMLALLGAIAVLGLYKQSGGGFWFDFRFSFAKITGMVVGLLKGIVKGFMIKQSLKTKKEKK